MSSRRSRRSNDIGAWARALFVASVVACGPRPPQGADPAQAKPPVVMPAPAADSAATAEAPAFARLIGRWVRTDGGYVLEIRAVDPQGKVEAAYLNPRPIHVEQALATRAGGTLTLFVELQDVNYPGSTYNLGYDPASDQLKGIYFQAVERTRYEVVFVRRR